MTAFQSRCQAGTATTVMETKKESETRTEGGSVFCFEAYLKQSCRRAVLPHLVTHDDGTKVGSRFLAGVDETSLGGKHVALPKKMVEEEASMSAEQGNQTSRWAVLMPRPGTAGR